MVGACVDVNNFLVTQRLRLEKHNIASLTDSAAFIILKRFKKGQTRPSDVLYTLSDIQLTYNPRHNTISEKLNGQQYSNYIGSPSLTLFLNGDNPKVTHQGSTQSGYIFRSTWERP
ncbi:MAG: hypothetical protein OEZ36_09305, partial [Spirochaetota bacterium]|nr:hypothetical protein [Spirochaetota bacterium]